MQQAASWFLLVLGLVIAASDFPDAIWEPLTPRGVHLQPVTESPAIAATPAISPEKKTRPDSQTVADAGPDKQRTPTLPRPEIVSER